MRKPKYKYMVHVHWSQEDGAYVVSVPELPGCSTHGESYEVAIKNAQDAIASWIEGARESGYPIPEPLATVPFSGKFITRVDPELHRALVIKAKEVGKSLNAVIQELLQMGVDRGVA